MQKSFHEDPHLSGLSLSIYGGAELTDSDQGWIKLYRRLINKGYYQKSQYVHLWHHLLLSANHTATEFMFNGKIIEIPAGSFITGRKKLSNSTGISETTIERILKVFESEHQIGQQKTSKYRLISILNWDKHQGVGQENGQQMDNKRTTNGHQADTNKNDKNIKNEKKTTTKGKIECPNDFKNLELYSDKTLPGIQALWNKWESVKSAGETAYPGIDIVRELKKAHAWEIANTSKRKTDRLKFLNNWFKRAQDDPRTPKVMKPKRAIDSDIPMETNIPLKLETQKTWAEICEAIKTEVGTEDFKTWIEPITDGGREGEYLVLIMPSVFHKDWIESNYMEKIRRAAK